MDLRAVRLLVQYYGRPGGASLPNEFVFHRRPYRYGQVRAGRRCRARLDAEVVSVDAFQIYRGLDLLTAKPDAATLAKVPHHLMGTVPITEEMNAEKFRQLALDVIRDIQSRGKLAIVAGGSGLYVKALTHGLNVAPAADAKLRAELDGLSLEELQKRLVDLDPERAHRIDMKNRRRVSRALEVRLWAGRDPEGRSKRSWNHPSDARGVFVFREREELQQRIKQRVDAMFEQGIVDEVRGINETGTTAGKMIGFREIREHLKGEMSILQAREKIAAATRQYAKRQLTWFRHQTSFEQLNLSPLTHVEAVKWISHRALRSCAKG